MTSGMEGLTYQKANWQLQERGLDLAAVEEVLHRPLPWML